MRSRRCGPQRRDHLWPRGSGVGRRHPALSICDRSTRKVGLGANTELRGGGAPSGARYCSCGGTMIRQAVILAGGKGTRLRERLNGRPKPLVDIDGIPLLGRQILALRASGFSEIVILVNHLAEQIEAYCASPAFAGLCLTLLDD